jgi:hypothetical protein
MREWRQPGMQLLVTSRDEPHIRESLSPAKNEEIVMKNAEINRDNYKLYLGTPRDQP